MRWWPASAAGRGPAWTATATPIPIASNPSAANVCNRRSLAAGHRRAPPDLLLGVKALPWSVEITE